MNIFGKISVAVSCYLMSAVALAGEGDDWTLTIEQSGNKYESLDSVKLKKAPFTLIFNGDKSLSYAVLASENCAEISALKDTAAISKFIRPGNIVVEATDRTNKNLVVHYAGAIPSEDNQSQVWSEEPKYERYSFQSYVVNENSRALAKREVEGFTMYRNYKEEKDVRLGQYTGKEICVLVTGLPPVGRMAHTHPKHIRIQF